MYVGLAAIGPTVVTPPDVGAIDVQVVPFEVKTLPFVPGATTFKELVPFPNKTLFAVNVVDPVPPFATATVPLTFPAVPVVF